MEIKALEKVHWPEVKQIYEEGIATGMATFETQAPDCEAWDISHVSYGRLIAEEDGKVLGWAALSPTSNRCVYAGVAEVSVYVAADARGKGIGKLLLQRLVEESEKENLWLLQAGIIAENETSARLHEKCGFRIVGYREKLGQLNNRWHDVLLLEKRSKIIGV